MDIIDRHFAAENAHDVDATLATYTDDIVWDDVTHPLSPFEGKEAVGAVYSESSTRSLMSTWHRSSGWCRPMGRSSSMSRS